MKPAGVHHVSVCVSDVDAAVDFYTRVLGFTTLPRPDFGFGGAWLDTGGGQVHLMQSDAPRPQGDHFALRVDDLDEAVADIRASGWKVDPVPHMAGAGRQAFLHDPSGNMIELNQPDAP
jgi:catechol 2,3-dioxygenase-like lactoylglutathione lyase family enzyme